MDKTPKWNTGFLLRFQPDPAFSGAALLMQLKGEAFTDLKKYKSRLLASAKAISQLFWMKATHEVD